MDPATIDTFVHGAKVVGVVVAAAVATEATFLGGMIGFMSGAERRYLVNQMMPAYEAGHYAEKPTLFNVYRLAPLAKRVE